MRYLSFIVLILTLLDSFVEAQISSSSHITTQNTSYTSTNQDVIYFYKQEADVALSAKSVWGGSNNTFVWSKFISGSGSWQPFLTQIGASSDVIGIGEGGYRVVVDNGSGVNEIYTCWVFVPQILGDAQVDTVYSRCNELKLKVTGVTVKPLSYFNPANNQLYEMNNYLKYSWLADEVELQNTRVSICTLDAPYNDTKYKCIITDSLTNQNVTSPDFALTAIAVKADFEKEFVDVDDENKFHENQDESAKLTVYCYAKKDGSKNQSQGNINVYNWYFGENTIFGGGETESWVYRTSNTYWIKLTVANDRCSSTSDSTDVTVSDIELKVPNYMNPDNSDETIKVFRVTYHSVKDFSMVIVNRWGRVVFETKDPDEGWNGRIGGQKAAPGVYYYDIVAKGYNEGDSKHKKGFLHLMYDHK